MFNNGIGQQAYKTLSKAKFWASGHAPELLMAAGVASFGATIYFTAKGAIKASDAKKTYNHTKELIEEELATNDTYTEDLHNEDIRNIKRDYIKNVVKASVPAVGCGVVSLTCFTGEYHILKDRFVKMVIGYKTIDSAFKTYRKNVISELGEEADFRFKNSARIETETVTEVDEDGKKHKKKKKVNIIEDEPNGYSFIYDDQHSMASVTNSIVARDNLVMAEQSANNILKARGYITLNEVLRSIGLHETSAGQIVGWQTKGDGDGFVSFNPTQIRTALDDDGVAFLLEFNVDGPIYQDIDKYTRMWGEQ